MELETRTDEPKLKQIHCEGWPDVASALERLKQKYFM